jgi:uncharacterized protein YpuA (DUF1002 family)
MKTEVKTKQSEKIEQIAKSLENHLNKNLSSTRDLLQKLSEEERTRVLDWAKTYHQLTLQKVSELIEEYDPKKFYEGLMKYFENTKPPF